VKRLAELGIVAPDDDGLFGEGSVRRVRLVRLLEHTGIQLEGIAAVVATGTLSFEMLELATEGRFAPYSDETFATVSQRTGIPFELLMVIREATGSAPPSPEDRLREDELDIVNLVEYQLELGSRPAGIERSLRVFGETLRRFADTESDWWYAELVAPRRAAGLDWTAIGAFSAETAPELSRRSDRAYLALLHSQQSHAWMRNILEGVESAIVKAGMEARPERAPPAICFLDITGYARLTEERGDSAAASLADQLARMVQRASARQGGKPVKWLGDGVMFHFPDAGPGVLAALEMVEEVSAAGLPPAHVGLDAGPVLFQDGDYFGRTVNIASRIADYARPGEVVVSQAVVDITAPLEVRYSEIGTVELKGIAEAIRLHIAGRGP
jgi:adenylate cyclase